MSLTQESNENYLQSLYDNISFKRDMLSDMEVKSLTTEIGNQRLIREINFLKSEITETEEKINQLVSEMYS